jgi:hypothetical protein
MSDSGQLAALQVLALDVRGADHSRTSIVRTLGKTNSTKLWSSEMLKGLAFLTKSEGIET